MALLFAGPSGPNVFAQNCSVCHGPKGHGDGPAAAGLQPRPADFTDPRRKAKMTRSAQVRIVTNGGGAEKLSPTMPAFGEVLSPEEIEAVVDYIRGLK